MLLKELLALSICKRKGAFERLKLKGEKGKYYDISIALKSILTDSQNLLKGNFEEQIKEKVSADLFLSKSEYEADVSVLAAQINRYWAYEKKLGRTLKAASGSVSVPIGKVQVAVPYDAIYEADDSVEVIKFETSAPTLSSKARNEENKPENSIELYMLYRAGEILFNGKKVSAALYHLKNKDDKLDLFVDEFDNKPNKNIISHSFTEEECTQIHKRIEEIINQEVSIISEYAEVDTHCTTCPFLGICKREQEIELNKAEKPLKKAGKVKLTDSQREAIFYDKGVCVIFAGAGSGKTSVLALKVVKLLKDGVNPGEILLITFTKKACQEMKEKIKYWLDMYKLKVDANEIGIYTFNSFGMMLVQKVWEKIGFSKKPTTLTKVEKYDILFELLEKYPIEEFNYRNPLMNFPNAKGSVVELDWYIDLIQKVGIKSEAELEKYAKISPILAEKIFNLYRKYTNKIKEECLVDYAGQIKLAKDIVSKQITGIPQFNYILVDEYQDADPAQDELVYELYYKMSPQLLAVVGDDAQAIFGFRLADNNNILNFHKKYPNVKRIFLSENFRSTKQILYTADQVIKNNKNRIKKDLISGSNKSGIKPQLYPFSTLDEENENIAMLISNLLKTYSYTDIAVIARTNDELITLHKVLQDKGISSVLASAQKIIENQGVKDIISFAKFVDNPENTIAAAEVFFGRLDNKQLKLLSKLEPERIYSFLRGVIINFGIPADDKEKLDFFFRHLEDLSLSAVAKEFLETIKEKNFLAMSALNAYLNKLVKYEDDSTLEDDTTLEAITLITAHSAKGKEYPVTVIKMDKFDYDDKKDAEEKREEERRLFFVALTRAMDELHLFYHTNEDKKRDKGKYSAFVKELEGVEVSKVNELSA